VGFLKYWTLSNIPLFFLATPMLFILVTSSLSTWNAAKMLHPQPTLAKKGSKIRNEKEEDFPYNQKMAQCMAIPQLVLAALALTSYHVQIVTRLSSGYPLWILWLASIILGDHKSDLLERKWRLGTALTRWIVLYALIQGGLFASFLPPA
jgi:GPI mannosyltransferase 2